MQPEDRFLTEQPFVEYNRALIDTRWAGGWLTPNGTYYPVDYRKGVTHQKIADKYGKRISSGGGSLRSQPPMIRLFNIAGWMRITFLEYSSFCVELKGNFVEFAERGMHVEGCELGTDWYSLPEKMSDEELNDFKNRRKFTLLKFVRDYSRFDRYFINNTWYNTFLAFKSAIGKNEVHERSNEFRR